MKSHYERLVVLCCFLIFFTNIGLPSTSFNVFQPYLAALPAVGNTGGSIILAFRTLVSLICMFMVKRFVDTLGARKAATVASLSTTLGFVLYSFANSIPTFFLGAFFAGAGYGLGGMIIVTLVTRRWFAAGVATALGIATMGSSASSMFLSPLVARIIEAFGLSWGFRFEALVGLVMALTIFAFLRDDPAELGLEPYRGKAKKSSPAKTNASEHKGRTEPLPTFTMALLILGTILTASVSVNAYNYMAILFVSEGIDTLSAASYVAIMGAALTIAKFVSGLVMDRIGTLRGTIILFALMAAGLLCACLSGLGSFFPLTAVLLYGSGVTLGSVGISLWSMELATPETFTKTTKNLQVAYAFGGFAFSMVPGPLMDLFGSYVVSYAILLAFTIIGGVLIVGIYLRNRA